MTPQQALTMLDGAVSAMALNRQQHANLTAALNTLAQACGATPQPIKAAAVGSEHAAALAKVVKKK